MSRRPRRCRTSPVPAGSPGFANQSLIVAEWRAADPTLDRVAVYDVDPMGDPMVATRREFFHKFLRPWGAYFEPITGDYLFLSWGRCRPRLCRAGLRPDAADPLSRFAGSCVDRRMLRAAALALLICAADRAHACPQQRFSDAPLTPAGALLLDDGGVLMTQVAGNSDEVPHGGVQLHADGAIVETTEEPLAPTLWIVRPKIAARSKHSLELVGTNGHAVRTFDQDAGGKPLAAPNATIVSTLSKRDLGRGPYPAQGEMRIALTEDPPADAFVIVISVMRGKDRQGIAWAPVVKGQRGYTIGQYGKGCQPGNAAAQQGDRIVLQWFDIHGRGSARSGPIAVGVGQR